MSVIEETNFALPHLAGPIPPARPLPFFKFMRAMQDNGLTAIPQIAYEEPFVEINMVLLRMLMVSDPAAVKQVLLDQVGEFPKTELEKRILGLGVGKGLLTSDGETWRAHRRIMAPSFDHRSIQSYAPVITEATTRHLDRWDGLPDGAVVDIADDMMEVTLDIISRTMFSTDSNGMVEMVDQALRGFQKTVHFGLFDLLPGIGGIRWRQRERAVAAAFVDFDREIRRLIAGRVAGAAAGGPDLLGRLIAARDEETGGGMSAEELRDQIVTIFLAGHETTAVAMSWTWYLLSQHPAALAILEAEIESALGGRAPRHEDMAKLPYARMVIEESMRLYPPAPGLSARVATTDRMIGDRKVAKGTMITVMPWVLHRHKLLWDAPDRFDPERFSPARSAGRHRFAYLPFGGGPRICIGAAFAMTEAVLILATMAQRYRLSLVPDQRIDPHHEITLRPRHGMKMRLERRDRIGETGVRP